MLEVVLIRLGNANESTNTILDMLNAIFAGDKDKVMNFIPRSDPEGVKEVEDMLYLYDIVKERTEKRLIEQAKEQGIQEVIQKFVELCQEIGDSKENAMQRLVKKFDITNDKAEEYMKKYWKA